ncbi:esterase-like activity of phytase family protein [Agarilytica rhodophyticola]|uniref:esterase-like activity of phytase family protein n=1 Tax=Agarilytica rhodophyticola TaxID=1737490 RepID=UPI000B3443C7|nr:esterase-like activity of phytase family protein [Agarilytica rhodophyticola]
MFRSVLSAALLSVCALPVSAKGNFYGYELEFIGEAQVPSRTMFEDTIFGGISGIDYNTDTNSYVAISDDRSAPRYYNLNIDLQDGWLDNDDIEITRVTTILDKDGLPFTTRPDPEGIRVMPFPGLLYWTSERQEGDTTPFTRVMSADGRYLAEFDLPEKFVGIGDTAGTRNNVGFESITYGRNTSTLFVANESALVQDGEKSTLTSGSPARVMKLNAKTGKAKQEYIYMVEPIAQAPVPSDGFADSGLVELLTLDKNVMIAMERSFSIGVGYSVKLYLTTTRGATEVSRFDSIQGKKIRPMRKRLLLDLDDLGITPDNVEGMTLGPKINGQRTLILVSDDNFSAFGPQVNQFIGFKIHDYYWKR